MKVPLSSIILWGFSLGSFPTITNASKYSVGGVILQSPLASISTFLDGSDDKYDCQLYDSDCLNI